MSQSIAEVETGLETLKSKMKATWMSGDFDRIAQLYEPGAVAFIKRLYLKPGMRVLDVACGSGNLAIPAARLGAAVSGLDIAPNLLETARKRAGVEGLNIRFDEGDVEAMPYKDGSFDVVVSMFGAMFAPQPEITAAELLRVCRPGGRIAMANWTPEGFIGQMFKTTATRVKPPNIPSPLLWGNEVAVSERFGSSGAQTRFTRRMISFRVPMSPAETVDYFRTWYGPTLRAFAALDEEGQAALQGDLARLWSVHNRAVDGTTHVQSEYLEVHLAK